MASQYTPINHDLAECPALTNLVNCDNAIRRYLAVEQRLTSLLQYVYSVYEEEARYDPVVREIYALVRETALKTLRATCDRMTASGQCIPVVMDAELRELERATSELEAHVQSVLLPITNRTIDALTPDRVVGYLALVYGAKLVGQGLLAQPIPWGKAAGLLLWGGATIYDLLFPSVEEEMAQGVSAEEILRTRAIQERIMRRSLEHECSGLVGYLDEVLKDQVRNSNSCSDLSNTFQRLRAAMNTLGEFGVICGRLASDISWLEGEIANKCGGAPV